MSTKSEEDLTTIRGVHQYLLRQDLVPPDLCQSAITRMTGGVANFTYHVELPEPFYRKAADGEKFPTHTTIFKYSAHFIAVMPSTPFDVARWDYEKLALVELKDFVTQDIYDEKYEIVDSSTYQDGLAIFVRTPQVYFTDDVKKVIYMEDAGPRAITLKELLKRPDLDKFISLDIARAIGISLAHFIFNFHQWGKEMNKDNVRRIDQFSNETARKFCAWRTFGRLLESCEKYMDDTNPQSDQRKTLKQIQATMTERIMTDDITVTMGDFWTGNVLIDLHNYDASTPLEDFVPGMISMFIIDWEFIHPGSPCADLSQMTAEFHCSERFAETLEGKRRVKCLSEAFLIEYSKLGGRWEVGAMMVQEGAHVVTWVENAGWSDDKSKVEMVAREGLRKMEMGWQRMQATKDQV